MLLHRFSSPWVLDSVFFSLWPVTTTSTTTATGEHLLQDAVQAWGCVRAAAAEHHSHGLSTAAHFPDGVGMQGGLSRLPRLPAFCLPGMHSSPVQ